MSKNTGSEIRIIAGTFRGQKLHSPPTLEVRPMLLSMRETLFNILESQKFIKGRNILDAFGGTGSLGIEALSRGAKQVVFAERNVLIAKSLQQNVKTFGLTDKSVIHVAPVFAAQPEIMRSAPFDLVLFDPPFRFLDPQIPPQLKPFDDPDRMTFIYKTNELLKNEGIFAEKALFFLHHHKKFSAPKLHGLELHKTRVYGINALTTYRKGFINADEK